MPEYSGTTATTSLILMYASLFYQLVAGPIVRYRDIAEEMNHRTVTLNLFSKEINHFVTGLSEKIHIAISVGEVSTHFLQNEWNSSSALGVKWIY